MKEEYIKKQMAILDNMIFPSKEDEDSIEHVDCGYEEFMRLLETCMKEAFELGRISGNSN